MLGIVAPKACASQSNDGGGEVRPSKSANHSGSGQDTVHPESTVSTEASEQSHNSHGHSTAKSNVERMSKIHESMLNMH